MSSPSVGKNNSVIKELEKYVKHMFFKTAQIIIQSRQGGKSFTESQPNPKCQSWFSLAINDNSEITHEAKKVVSSAQVAGQGILAVPMCIEISLKTTEGDLLVLENWVVSMKDGSDPVVRPNAVYNQMGLLLKSLLCVSRVLPAYKFARSQGPDTHVMCYRVFAGEPSSNPLGSGQQTAHIGQVMTGYSTICIRAEYRTQMTIIPCCKTGGMGSDPNFSCSSSSQQSAPIFKSDHFAGENLDLGGTGGAGGIIRKNISNPDCYGADNPVTTSDESSDAMRIFAASPPDNYVHKRFSDHYSSNESIGIKFRSRSNTNQSHKSEDASETTEVKVGAFATKKNSTDSLKPSDAGISVDEDFLDLFNLEKSNEEQPTQPTSAAASPAVFMSPKSTAAKSIAEKSSAKKAIFFVDEPEESKKKGDFVMLDTPFSVANTLDNPQGDLGVFFKEVQSAPQIMTECNRLSEADLETQLNSFSDQLSSYENKSAEYEDLLKMLEATATTSESESEAS